MSDPVKAYGVLGTPRAGNPAPAYGDVVRMARTNPNHLPGIGEKVAPAAGPERSFGELLLGALGSVNDSQVTSMDLTQRMIANPDSVNVHDVTIALAEANLALSMTKSIVDRALTAYREIINIR
ncbi:MAG TPA: flagellar hook-basal body complex protein FliE [Spirochaetia bacterium]|nr:flagellar hook-basal body complex protein FliE [Spirochaetia bacterium]